MTQTFRLGGQVFQERAIIRVYALTLLFHLLLNSYRSHNEWIDPTSDRLLVFLTLIFKELENRPIVSQGGPPPNQRLDTHERVGERVEPIVCIREGVEVLSEEEFRRGIDREPRDEVLEVERVVGVGIEHDVDHFLGVPLEEIEV